MGYEIVTAKRIYGGKFKYHIQCRCVK